VVNSPVDWALAERVAGRFIAREPWSQSYHYRSLEHDFARVTPQAEALVADTTGLTSANGLATATVISRPEWVKANLSSMQLLLAPLLAKMEAEMSGRNARAAAAGAVIAGAEVGAMLGWMSGRVLGQYDLMVGDTATGDCVYYVGPNVLALEKRFGFPPAEFRLWLALHEVTHRAQFTGVPWMKAHFLGLVHEILSAVEPDADTLVAAIKSAVRPGGDRKQIITDGGIMALLASPAQRAIMGRIGGLMALLEGHGDVTMNRAGIGLVPSAERFDRVLKERRGKGSPLVKLVQKLAGIEAKMNQYEQGEKFIAAIEAVGGDRVVDRCWENPDHLPSLEEIRRPDLWLDRLGLTVSV
jgi:coenzyme F420 biosynthesis associated uncharacterized protein